MIHPFKRDAHGPSEPLTSAKASIAIDLAPVGRITGSGQISANSIGPVMGAMAWTVGSVLASVIPWATLHAGKGALTSIECISLVGAQLALVTIFTFRAARGAVDLAAK